MYVCMYASMVTYILKVLISTCVFAGFVIKMVMAITLKQTLISIIIAYTYTHTGIYHAWLYMYCILLNTYT